MTIIDALNSRIARAQASDRELARITGQTVEEMDADTTAPDGTLVHVRTDRYPGTNWTESYWRDSDGQVWKYDGSWQRVTLA